MNADKAQMLKLTTDQIESKYGKGSIMLLGDDSSNLNVEAIPTGALPLDEYPSVFLFSAAVLPAVSRIFVLALFLGVESLFPVIGLVGPVDLVESVLCGLLGLLGNIALIHHDLGIFVMLDIGEILGSEGLSLKFHS